MPLPETRVIFFDLFETLVTEVAADYPMQPSPARRLGIDDEIYRRVRRLCHHNGMTRQIDYRDILTRACHAAGVELTESIRALIDDIYVQRLHDKAAPFGRVDDTVLEMLRQLRARGIRLALISNCSAEEVTAWGTSALAAMFDEVVFSYQVGYVKPDPEIYLLACRRLGVSPAQAVFVGDGGSDELRGATAVGMRAYAARWFVNNLPEQARDLADSATTGFTRLADPDALLTALGHH